MSPKAFIFTMAWPSPAVGFEMSDEMYRESAGPIPPLMSRSEVSYCLDGKCDVQVEGGEVFTHCAHLFTHN